jgi:hypothetical protein
VSTPNPWAILGIEPTQDVLLIRRAYAAMLKRMSPDEDPVGFANLRQAYEQALMHARMTGAGVAGPAAVRSPASVADPAPITPSASVAAQDTAPPANPPAQATPAPPTDLDQLRDAFVSLQQTAVAPGTPNRDALRALLDTCLHSPALENLSIQLEFEPALIRFFAQTLPRTQFLLETVIEHWKWRDRPRTAGSGGVAVLVAHADNLRRLDNLHASTPRVYHALTRPPRPWLLWAQMVLFGLESEVREALGEFRNLSPGIFDPQAQEWWSRFFSRPHIQPGMIRGGGALTLAGVLFGGLAGADNNRFLAGAAAGGLAGALAGLVVTGLWLGLVDWPRFRLSATRRGASLWLRLGWAPAGLGACLVSALLPDMPAVAYGALAIAIALVTWANLMAPAVRILSTNSLLGRIVATVVVNVPLGVWWVLLSMAHLTRPTTTMTVVLVATMLAFAIGQQQLWIEFQNGLTANARQRARAALAAIAAGFLALLLFTRGGSDDNHFLLMCMVIVVIAHRTPALNLNVQQLKIRHYLTFVPAVLLASREDLSSVLRIGGILLMTGVAVSMGACLYNDWKASREGAPWKTTNA